MGVRVFGVGLWFRLESCGSGLIIQKKGFIHQDLRLFALRVNDLGG